MPDIVLSSMTANRPDEWRIEQGLAGAELPVLDMTGPEIKAYAPQVFGEPTIKDQAAIDAVGNPDELFVREREGWVGYVFSVGIFVGEY